MTRGQHPEEPRSSTVSSIRDVAGLPDVTSEEFRLEARRQARLAAASPGEEEIMEWLESVSIPFDELDDA